MKNNLDLIIKELRKERRRVEKELNENVKFGHYTEAEYSLEQLSYILGELEKFYQLKNPNINEIRYKVDEIKRTQRTIKRYERLHPNLAIDSIRKRLEKSKKELIDLKSKKAFYSLDETLIHELLEDLIFKKIKRFKFLLIARSELVLRLRMIQSDLIIELNGDFLQKRKYSFQEQRIRQLKKIGFDFHGLKMERLICDFDQEKILFVIEILARVIYDAFYVGELDDPINLIIEE